MELKNCVVLDKSEIGRLSFVGDSVIGENVDIGAGCMTVNRNTNWEKIQVKKREDQPFDEHGKIRGICW